MKNDFVKLTNAVYKLLEFFPESDPLKNRSKEKALSIMSALGGSAFGGENDEGWVSIGDFLSQNREKAKLEILEDIKVLLNYFEVAKAQGWLSDVNFLIISNGYEKIKKEIGFPIIVENLAQKTPESAPLAKEIEKKYEEKSGLAWHKTSARQVPLSPTATARQEKIIEFLENNPQAQVADLIAVLPNVTKRTIRRDLDELLKTGRIARMGEYNQIVYKINKVEIS